MLCSKDHSIYFSSNCLPKAHAWTPQTVHQLFLHVDLWYMDGSWVHLPAKHFSSSRDQDFRRSSTDVTQNIKKACAPRLRFKKSKDYFWFIKSILEWNWPFCFVSCVHVAISFLLLPWRELLYHQSKCQQSRKADLLNVVTKTVSSPWIPGRVLGVPSHGPRPSPWKLSRCLHGYHSLVTWAGWSGTCVMGQKGSRTLDVSGHHGCSSRLQCPEKFIHCSPISRPSTGRCTDRTKCLRETLPLSQSENLLLDS